jgi:hypothetical protein
MIEIVSPRSPAMLLWVAVLLPALLLIPVLIWPHYGLFSDAGQAIAFPREVLNNFPQSLLLLRPLEDGRWNPFFHGLTIIIYAIAPDSPRALYVAQFLMFIGATASMAWVIVRLTQSNWLAVLGVVLFCFGSGIFENFFTLDKVEPRITLFSAIATALLVTHYLKTANENSKQPNWYRFVAIQALLGVLIVFSKETGAFLAAAFIGTWVASMLNPQWGKHLRKPLAIGAITHVTVIVIFVVLFQLLSVSMSYRYVTYDISVALVSRNLAYYALSSPELALGLCCAVYWSLACLVKRLPGPLGVQRIILTFASFATLAYLAGLSIWRWALDYYLLPAQFMAVMTLVLTIWTLLPYIQRRLRLARILAGIAFTVWLGYLIFRILLGSAIYAQDEAKDKLAKLLSMDGFISSRLVLPFAHPDSAEIGERLEFFIGRKRSPEDVADLYNFWESPFLNRDNLNRFVGGAGIAPTMRQLSDVAAKPGKYVIWQFGSIPPNESLKVTKRTLAASADGIAWSTEDIWNASYLRVGDLILVPVGKSWLKIFLARGVRMYRQNTDDFTRRTPLKMTLVGGVRSGIKFAELGWDVLRVDEINEDDPKQPYGVTLLLNTNSKTDIVPLTSTTTLFEEHRLPSNGLLLGTGWHGLERASNVRFRWMGESSEIALTNLRAGGCELEFDVEPLLLPRLPEFVLTARSGGRFVDYPLQGRQTIRFNFQAEGKPVQVIRLEARGGMTSSPPGDVRLLKARVFGFRLLGACSGNSDLVKQ